MVAITIQLRFGKRFPLRAKRIRVVTRLLETRYKTPDRVPCFANTTGQSTLFNSSLFVQLSLQKLDISPALRTAEKTQIFCFHCNQLVSDRFVLRILHRILPHIWLHNSILNALYRADADTARLGNPILTSWEHCGYSGLFLNHSFGLFHSVESIGFQVFQLLGFTTGPASGHSGSWRLSQSEMKS